MDPVRYGYVNLKQHSLTWRLRGLNDYLYCNWAYNPTYNWGNLYQASQKVYKQSCSPRPMSLQVTSQS